MTGDEWPVPIRSARAVIQLPSEVTGVDAKAWTGAHGSREQEAEIRIQDARVEVATRAPLEFKEGLTVAVKWDPGVIERPTAADEARWFLTANWPLGFPVLAFGLMFHLWRSRGRDPEVRSIAPQYEPPDDLSPAEVGVVIDNSPDMRDVTATLVDLAVRGFLTIEEREEEKLLGLLTDREYLFHMKRGPEEWDGLRGHERTLLRSLFEGGSRPSVELSDLENEFYEDLSDIKDGLVDALIEHRVYRRRPDRLIAMYLGIGVGGGILVLVFGLVLAEGLGLAPAAVVAAALLTAGVVAGFAFVMPARTLTGARLLEKVRGFEEFLQRVESDRFRRMITGPEMFEKYLPFAMALGVEKKWAKAFEGLYTEPPAWYRGADFDGFRPGIFVADLGRMSSRAGSAMSSSPRSSGGSGFGGGGGGFSGGGFGGGGGGAF